MSKLYEQILERIEYHGGRFFEAITPRFLNDPDLDMEKISYQLFVGACILGLIAWAVIWFVDRRAERNKLRESRLITFGWKDIKSIHGEQRLNESALEVMLRRQEEQMEEATRLKLEMESGKKRERNIYNVNDKSLPTFFKS
ncbi:hypothetical protein [Pseudobacteriovorax antillogorgiicola]|uniref:Uncharacterized protein n=1 Tax=Pseudobacteriovorax antillogorgiicola TaxID=1513793 RepID=A0A1Y6BKV6_9BACT|nr:hypothetical protein [Pseudobacteriovorax antillogorgiicola]TCS55385.1 hypothetical protein EDD56_105106 [Pseudobacteriovorax antillogorgiicola]SMF13192.1 hypothetical protein SAMN06296036_105218 [Pseudobacteriovorax antillogorgiicola]